MRAPRRSANANENNRVNDGTLESAHYHYYCDCDCDDDFLYRTHGVSYARVYTDNGRRRRSKRIRHTLHSISYNHTPVLYIFFFISYAFDISTNYELVRYFHAIDYSSRFLIFVRTHTCSNIRYTLTATRMFVRHMYIYIYIYGRRYAIWIRPTIFGYIEFLTSPDRSLEDACFLMVNGTVYKVKISKNLACKVIQFYGPCVGQPKTENHNYLQIAWLNGMHPNYVSTSI